MIRVAALALSAAAVAFTLGPWSPPETAPRPRGLRERAHVDAPQPDAAEAPTTWAQALAVGAALGLLVGFSSPASAALFGGGSKAKKPEPITEAEVQAFLSTSASGDQGAKWNNRGKVRKTLAKIKAEASPKEFKLPELPGLPGLPELPLPELPGLPSGGPAENESAPLAAALGAGTSLLVPAALVGSQVKARIEEKKREDLKKRREDAEAAGTLGSVLTISAAVGAAVIVANSGVLSKVFPAEAPAAKVEVAKTKPPPPPPAEAPKPPPPAPAAEAPKPPPPAPKPAPTPEPVKPPPTPAPAATPPAAPAAGGDNSLLLGGGAAALFLGGGAFVALSGGSEEEKAPEPKAPAEDSEDAATDEAEAAEEEEPKKKGKKPAKGSKQSKKK